MEWGGWEVWTNQSSCIRLSLVELGCDNKNAKDLNKLTKLSSVVVEVI